jgi:YebC/PmpR family DNA-binding regulatory protein
MSGHSKWSTIKRKKGALDAKKGKIFTKIAKEISLAARLGGGDPEGNSRLRQAILAAKAENMPKDNIDRAVKKGSGDLDGGQYEEITYEGYGPGGVAVLVEVMTDNRNRTVAEIRHIFSKYGGNLAENGAVSWIFAKKGSILVEKKGVSEDALMELALDAGAEDVREDEDAIEVITEAPAFESVKKVFDDHHMKYAVAQIDMVPQTSVKLEGKSAETMLKLMEALEDSDDVQEVHANFDISGSEMERLSQ